MANHKEAKGLLKRFRTKIVDFRVESNKMCDKYLKWVDDEELRLTKEEESLPEVLKEEEIESHKGRIGKPDRV